MQPLPGTVRHPSGNAPLSRQAPAPEQAATPAPPPVSIETEVYQAQAQAPIAPPTAVLRVLGLSKHYVDVPVFSNIDLLVLPGEFVAIVGESGVGKSTLLNCLAGLDTWNSGSVRLGGIDIGKLSDTARALLRRRMTGFVFQAFHVLPHLTVAQNVALPLVLLGQGKDPALPLRVDAALESVGLDGFGARLPQQLSGGQLQRVAIARALIHRPPLLLADEPTGNVDSTTAAKVLDSLITQVREHQASLILATHSASVAAKADRVLLLRPDGLYPTKRPPLKDRLQERAQTLVPVSKPERFTVDFADSGPVPHAEPQARDQRSGDRPAAFDRRG